MSNPNYDSTFFLSEGGAGVADAGAVRGSHENVVGLATEQVTQSAVGAGAAALERLTVAGSCQRIAHCICTFGPVDMSGADTAVQLAGHISRRTGLWRWWTTKHHQHFYFLIGHQIIE